MDCLESHQAGQQLLTHIHPLACHHLGGNSSHRGKPQQAAVLNIGDEIAHFVHMGGDEKGFCRGLPSGLLHNEIAQGIHPAVTVLPALERPEQILPHSVLLSRYSRQRREFPDSLGQFHVSFPPSQDPWQDR